MQANQMEEESESDQFSTLKPNKSMLDRQQSINFLQLAQLHLKQYEDIDENQFELVEQVENVNSCNATIPLHYLKLHTTFVPIGTNFQIQTPQIVSSSKYLTSATNQYAVRRLHALKVHDPQVNNQFFEKYKFMICAKFGQNRTYEDIVCLKKSMEEFEYLRTNDRSITFQEYLSIPQVLRFWEDVFKNKDAETLKRLNKKKKKKYKGSMDV